MRIFRRDACPALLLAAVLSACSGGDNKVQVQDNIMPTGYRPRILELLHGALEDPTNIRDAGISEPTLKSVGGTTRYVACVRYNAKDGSGQYMGIKTTAAIFYAGNLTQFVSPTGDQCTGVNYQPFPELMKLCRTINCQGGN